MNVRVGIAGFATPWRFRGSAALDEWLRTTPWNGGASVVTVRLPSSEAATPIGADLTMAIRGFDAGRTDVDVHSLTGVDLKRGLMHAGGQLFGLHPRGEPRAKLNQLARGIARPACVLIDSGSTGPELGEEARALAGDLGKVDGLVGLVFVLFDTRTHPQAPGGFDFTVGAPTEGVFDQPLEDEATDWRRYVHTRIAWEAAGDVGLAVRWSRDVSAGLRTGQDDEFERRLNCAASEQLAGCDRAVAEAATTYLDGVSRRRMRPDELRVVMDDLEVAGAFWRPPGDHRLAPAPWLARALLVIGRPPEQCLLLRTGLVCGPLARMVVGRCLEAEAVLRLSLSRQRSDQPPADAADLYRRFAGGDPAAGAGFYPKGHPSIPQDPWAFATLGQLLASVGGLRSAAPEVRQLLALRNHVAHGHFVGWAAVRMMRAIEARIGGG